MRSLSGRGRAWIGSHDCFHRAPDTPLVPACMCDNERADSQDLDAYTQRSCTNEWTLC